MKLRKFKSFKIGNRNFKIQYVRNHDKLDVDDMGWVDYEAGLILIRTHKGPEPLPEDAIQETLWHEVQHVQFWACGASELSEDESLVWRLSSTLSQILGSMK